MRAQAVLELGNRNAGFAHLCHGIKMAFISLRDRHHNKQMQKMWKFYNAEFCLCYLTEFVFSRNAVIRPDAFHTMMYTHQSRTCYSSRTGAWTLTSHRCKQLPKLKSRWVVIWHTAFHEKCQAKPVFSTDTSISNADWKVTWKCAWNRNNSCEGRKKKTSLSETRMDTQYLLDFLTPKLQIQKAEIFFWLCVSLYFPFSAGNRTHKNPTYFESP